MDRFTWIVVSAGIVIAGLTIGTYDPGEMLLAPLQDPVPNTDMAASAVDAPIGAASIRDGGNTEGSDIRDVIDYQCTISCNDRDVGYAWAEMRDTLDRERGSDMLGKDIAAPMRDSGDDANSD